MAGDGDVKYFWHEAPVPDRLKVTQVYGYLLCPTTARVLIQDDDARFSWREARAG
jgi:8-oxo-dGTP diphosphatase